MTTIKEIAEKLGISTTTVSNVIHGKTGEVSQKTVEKVERLLQEMDYIPNISARNLAQNQSKIIGVAMKARKDKYDNMLADPFFGELIGAIEARVRYHGYFMMMYISNDINEIISYVSTWNVDGLILIGMLHDDYVRVRGKYKKPKVLIDSYNPREITKYVNVGLEDTKGAYDMTKYLIECGHQKIAFLTDNLEGVDYYRLQGFEAAMEEAGLEAGEENIIILNPGGREWDASLYEVYCQVENYTAFMCASDYYAVKIMLYLQDHGIRVPEDISVTGFDDNLYGKTVRPALTTVHQNPSEKGDVAVDTLIKLVDGETISKDIRLPVQLVIRESVKTIAGEDEN